MAEASPLTPDEVQAMVNDLAGRCRDCRWWDGYGTTEGDRNQYPCLLAGSDYAGQPDHEDSCAIAFAGGDYPYPSASLLTAATFGCVQFRAREAT